MNHIAKMKIRRFFRSIPHTIQSCFVCMKYPFLYPRNRWTGNHWDSWILRDYLYGNGTLLSKSKEPCVWDKAFYNHFDDNGYLHRKVISYTWAIWFYIVKFISKGVLPLFHCIPEYTELDDMPKGWRKRFGIQMCDEIKAQLKKDKCLYRYRITQIKEKWGELRWYDAGHSKEIDAIINKYTELSRNVCISCGKDATIMSSGWISPYCDKCYLENTREGSIPFMRKVKGEWIVTKEWQKEGYGAERIYFR